MVQKQGKRLAALVCAGAVALTLLPAPARAAELNEVNLSEFMQGKTRSVSAGGSTLVLQEDGSLWGWGRANEGRLGNGGGYDASEVNLADGSTIYLRTLPEKVLDGVAALETSGGTSLALKEDGTLWATGLLLSQEAEATDRSALTYQETFAQVGENVVDMAYNHMVTSTRAEAENLDMLFWSENVIWMVKEDGSLWARWYRPALEGDLVTYTPEDELVMEDVAAVEAGEGCVLVLKEDGSVWTWGETGEVGQLGNGTRVAAEDRVDFFDGIAYEPVKILDDMASICAGEWFNAAIDAQGGLWVWGQTPMEASEEDYETQLEKTVWTTPRKVADGVSQVSQASNTGVAIVTEDGSLKIWGYFNPWTSSGTTDWTVPDIFAQPFTDTGVDGVASVYALGDGLYYITRDGALWRSCGGTDWGGASAPNQNPVQLTGLPAPGWQADGWAAESLTLAAASGLIPEELWNADLREEITRAEFAAVAVALYDAMGGYDTELSAENPFDDTDDPAVLRAYALGITTGTGAATFSPDAPLTREQAAAMLVRTYTTMEWNSVEQAPSLSFSDAGEISDWAADSVAFLAGKGILTGVGDNQFAPGRANQRQEAIVIALRMLEKLN